MFGGRLVREPDRRHQRFAFACGKRFVNLVGRLSAPAVRAEGDKLLFVAVQSLEIGEETGYGRHHIVVQGGGADRDVSARHGIRDDIGIVAEMQIVKFGLQSRADECALDRVCHRFGRVPHGIIDDDRAVVVFVGRPGSVHREDVVDVFRPDNAVAGADGLYGQRLARRKRLCRLHPVRLHDVRVVLARLDIRFRKIAFGIQPGVGRVMLAERVVGKQNIVRRHERDHVVRPMHHGRRHEGERPLAEAERLSVFDADIGKVAVIGCQVLDARAERGVHLCVFRILQDIGDRAAVVGFRMVGNDDLDSGGVDDGRDSFEHLFFERFLYRVDQGDFFVDDEIGVVSRALLRLVAVEIPQVPVDRAYPIDAFGNFNCFHSSLLAYILYC